MEGVLGSSVVKRDLNVGGTDDPLARVVKVSVSVPFSDVVGWSASRFNVGFISPADVEVISPADVVVISPADVVVISSPADVVVTSPEKYTTNLIILVTFFIKTNVIFHLL